MCNVNAFCVLCTNATFDMAHGVNSSVMASTSAWCVNALSLTSGISGTKTCYQHWGL